jgi:DNA polymerase-3 subunit gamma/tau
VGAATGARAPGRTTVRGGRRICDGVSLQSAPMAYQSLYRKYRPQRFSEMVGEAHVTTALRNAVRDERVGHAYLFSGPRGTGKTTSARILAKALNCLDRTPDGDACGVCDNCVGIAEGRFLDLFELDAASNNSVDDIRALTESVHLGLGLTATHKVYLIDEVHMLSANASNALLKTLEEPPEHVVFVLATTGPERVLPTIRSRTQHFEFTLYTLDEIAGHLATVCRTEGIDADPLALDVIARGAAGSMRDALSLLEQAIAQGPLEAVAIAELFGGTGFELRMRLLDALAGEDVPGALVALGELLDAGHDPRRITEDLLTTCRDAFLLTSAKGRVRVDAPADQLERLAAFGDQLGQGLLVRAMETLGQAVVDMRGTDAADPRLVLEIGLVRLARREAGPPLQVLAERVERLERAQGDRPAPSTPPGSDAASGPASPPAPRASRSLGELRAERANEPDAPAATSEPEPPSPPASPAPAPVGAPGPAAASTPAPAPAPAPAPTPAPAQDAAPSATVSGPPVDVALDDVVLAWSQVLPGLPPATRAAAQEAQPIAVDDGVITFGVPTRAMRAAEPRFRKEADAIRHALSERLGTTLKFKLVAHDGFSGGEGGSGAGARSSRPTSASAPSGTSTPPTGPGGRDEPPLGEAPSDEHDEPGNAADFVDLADPDAPVVTDVAVDSVAKFTQSFDATVVEEVPRD